MSRRRPLSLNRPSFSMSRKTARWLAIIPALALVAGLVVALWPGPDPIKVTAYFPRTVGIYPGSDVRVLGVKIGEVKKVDPQGRRVRVDFEYSPENKVPADAKAAIINSSVVSDRYVQLLPAYKGGPAMRTGASIPENRTAVPVELDRIYESLKTTGDALGPKGANQNGALSRLLNVSANNLDGQGKKMHQTIEDLSRAVTTLSDGRKDLFGTVRNLQVFTTALATDDQSVRQFNDSLAGVASQLSGERQDLGATLKQLSIAMNDVAGFVKGNKKMLTSNVKGLSDVTRVLVKQRAALKELMDVAPAGIGNLVNAYNPSSGTLDTRSNMNMPQDPASLICSILKTTGETKDCGNLKSLFGSLPDLKKGNPLTGLANNAAAGTASTDKTLGGILGAQA